jgi:hypothetical protein
MGESSKIVNLQDIRVKRRKRYLAQHGDRLSTFIEEFVENNMPFTISDLTQIYVTALQNDGQSNWCQLDFREVVGTAINHCLGEDLMTALESTNWYDKSFVCKEEVIDRSTSYFILRTGRAANN